MASFLAVVADMRDDDSSIDGNPLGTSCQAMMFRQYNMVGAQRHACCEAAHLLYLKMQAINPSRQDCMEHHQPRNVQTTKTIDQEAMHMYANLLPPQDGMHSQHLMLH